MLGIDYGPGIPLGSELHEEQNSSSMALTNTKTEVSWVTCVVKDRVCSLPNASI